MGISHLTFLSRFNDIYDLNKLKSYTANCSTLVTLELLLLNLADLNLTDWALIALASLPDLGLPYKAVKFRFLIKLDFLCNCDFLCKCDFLFNCDFLCNCNFYFKDSDILITSYGSCELLDKYPPS